MAQVIADSTDIPIYSTGIASDGLLFALYRLQPPYLQGQRRLRRFLHFLLHPASYLAVHSSADGPATKLQFN